MNEWRKKICIQFTHMTYSWHRTHSTELWIYSAVAAATAIVVAIWKRSSLPAYVQYAAAVLCHTLFVCAEWIFYFNCFFLLIDEGDRARSAKMCCMKPFEAINCKLGQCFVCLIFIEWHFQFHLFVILSHICLFLSLLFYLHFSRSSVSMDKMPFMQQSGHLN